jgi:hypothetical protein
MGLFNIMKDLFNRCSWGRIKMSTRGSSTIAIVFLLGITISACTRATTQEIVQPTEPPVIIEDPNPTQVPDEVHPTDLPFAENAPEEVRSPTEERAKPQLKTSLVATNPDSVTLTSGEPILVEFFAFW